MPLNRERTLNFLNENTASTSGEGKSQPLSHIEMRGSTYKVKAGGVKTGRETWLDPSKGERNKAK